MKNMPQKTILLLIILLVGILPACTSSVTPPPQAEQASPVPSQTAVEKAIGPVKTLVAEALATPQVEPTLVPVEKPVSGAQQLDPNLNPQDTTIVFWHAMPEEQIMPIIDEFNKSNEWGIKVKTVNKGGNSSLSENLKNAMIAKDTPQVVLAFADQAARWKMYGGVKNLSPFVDDPKWGLSADEQKDFLPLAWENGMVDNERLALPVQIVGNYLFYNQTWAKEMGFNAAPETPEQFQEQACAANQYMKKDADVKNDFAGGWILNATPHVMIAWLRAFGGDIVSLSNENVLNSKYTFDSKEHEDAFFFLRRLLEKKCAWDMSIVPATEGYPDEEFVKRRTLVVSGSLIDLPYQTMAFIEGNNKDAWTLIPYPSSVGKPVVNAQIPSFVLIQGTPQQELAGWLFMRWMTSSATQVRWSLLSGLFPTRISARDAMKDYGIAHPQWAAGLELLKDAQAEPVLPSWENVRWGLQDAGTQLFRSYFTLERVPLTLQELDRSAQDMIEMGK
ncbi:MAG: extracellular solute-binding protein [Chloroflexota bacterium]